MICQNDTSTEQHAASASHHFAYSYNGAEVVVIAGLALHVAATAASALHHQLSLEMIGCWPR